MKNRFMSTVAKCPFYSGENKQMVACGDFFTGSHIKLTFDTSGIARIYKNQFCKKRYKDCYIYSMLEDYCINNK